jgi:hypothetical protein
MLQGAYKIKVLVVTLAAGPKGLSFDVLHQQNKEPNQQTKPFCSRDKGLYSEM